MLKSIQWNTTLHTKQLLIDTGKNTDDLKSQIQECMPVVLHSYKTINKSKESLAYTVTNKSVFAWAWGVS